jgi:glutamate-1-semialdehyde 2,1-aminomutase
MTMDFLEESKRRYQERTPRSRELAQQAREVLPLGVSSSVRAFDPHPLFISSGQGARLTDVDGNEYIDFAMNFGAGLAGHAHPAVVKAVRDQVGKGTMYCLSTESEIELGRELRRRFGQEQWRPCNTGTEATMHALRIARGYTGRDKIIKFEGAYHGAHDAVLVSVKPAPRLLGQADRPRPIPVGKGIPAGVLQNTLVAQFNDLTSVERLLDENLNQVAALILEPIMLNLCICMPDDGFLQKLHDLCRSHGTLLIFDEVKTGTKVALGGASEYFKMKPDMVCLAKSIGGGLPIGAVGASSEIMGVVADLSVVHAGTFAGNPLSVAATLATLREALTPEATRHAFELSRKLAEGCAEIVRKHRLKATTAHVGAMGMVMFTTQRVRNYRDWLTIDQRLWQTNLTAMMCEGILPHPIDSDEQWTVSVQHTERDVEAFLTAFDKVAPRLSS